MPSEYKCTYAGFFLDRPLTISHDGECFIFHDTSEEDFLSVWADYFDLDTDYGEIKKRLSADETLKKACEFAGCWLQLQLSQLFPQYSQTVSPFYSESQADC